MRYVCLLAIHLYGLRNEDTLHFLRYFAFGLCWISKMEDGWDNIIWEVLTLALFVIPATILICQNIFGPFGIAIPFLDRKLQYKNVIESIFSAGIALACVVLNAVFKMESHFLNVIARIAFGAAAYYGWKMLPCMDKNKQNFSSFV